MVMGRMPREPKWEYSWGRSVIWQMLAASSRTHEQRRVEAAAAQFRRRGRRPRSTWSVRPATSGAAEPAPSLDSRYRVSVVWTNGGEVEGRAGWAGAG